MENYASTLTSMLISGLESPRLAAALGLIWVVGRVGYALGYTSADKHNVDGKGRFYYGGFHAASLSQIALLVLVARQGWDLLHV
jgi:glutathione S-transferase